MLAFSYPFPYNIIVLMLLNGFLHLEKEIFYV